MKKKFLWFQEMSAPDVVEYAKNVCDIAILPLGSIEQHGPHCPTGDDTYNAIGMCELMCGPFRDTKDAGEYPPDLLVGRYMGENVPTCPIMSFT